MVCSPVTASLLLLNYSNPKNIAASITPPTYDEQLGWLCFFFTTSTIVTTTFVFPRKLDCPFQYSTGFSGMPYMPRFYVSVFSF
ncbi:hypothetical protein Peur_024126 [Populus x canadensis]